MAFRRFGVCWKIGVLGLGGFYALALAVSLLCTDKLSAALAFLFFP
jgi:hypothetical protein